MCPCTKCKRLLTTRTTEELMTDLLVNIQKLRKKKNKSTKLSPFEKMPVAQLLNNLPTFYETRMFIAVLTRDQHWSLS
jgi:hypothetical protein